MFATAPAREVPAEQIAKALSSAGLPHEVTESTGEYDYIGTRDGNVGVTWYRRTRSAGPALVFELDLAGRSVSDAADTAPDLINLLNQTLADPDFLPTAA